MAKLDGICEQAPRFSIPLPGQNQPLANPQGGTILFCLFIIVIISS